MSSGLIWSKAKSTTLIWSKANFNRQHWSGQRKNQLHSFSTKTEIHKYFLTSSPKVFFPRQTTKGTSSLSRKFSSCRDVPSLQRYICSSGAWLAQIIIALAQPSKFYQTLKTWPKELAAVGMIVTHPQEDLCRFPYSPPHRASPVLNSVLHILANKSNSGKDLKLASGWITTFRFRLMRCWASSCSSSNTFRWSVPSWHACQTGNRLRHSVFVTTMIWINQTQVFFGLSSWFLPGAESVLTHLRQTGRSWAKKKAQDHPLCACFKEESRVLC